LNLGGSKYELEWADFTTAPLRSERRATPKFFAAGRKIAAKTSAFAAASGRKSARRRLLLAKIERENASFARVFEGGMGVQQAFNECSPSVH